MIRQFLANLVSADAGRVYDARKKAYQGLLYHSRWTPLYQYPIGPTTPYLVRGQAGLTSPISPLRSDYLQKGKIRYGLSLWILGES